MSGAWQLGLESAGRSVLRLDGEVVLDNSDPTGAPGSTAPGSEPIEVDVRARGRAVLRRSPSTSGRGRRSTPIMGARSGAAPPGRRRTSSSGPSRRRPRPTSPWWSSGSNGQWESEGYDRPDLSLPGRQRELVEAVLDANPRTVVVVNAGSPVEMPWAERAGAVLVPWYPGEEGADALADIIVGLSRPGGAAAGHVPGAGRGRADGWRATERYPGVDGKVVYGEGVFVGYRHYETAELAPLFPFGHGLCYGDVVWEDVRHRARAGRRVRLWNNGRATGHRGRAGLRARARSRGCPGPTGSWWGS